MSTDTLPYSALPEIIETSLQPILVFVVAAECMDHKSREEVELEAAIIAHKDDLRYIRYCVPDISLPFPLVQPNTLYYFIPKNQTPIFWRQVPLMSLDESIEIIQKVMVGMTYDQAKYPDETLRSIESTEKMFKEEQLSEYPSNFAMFRNFAKDFYKSAKQVARNLPVLLPADVAFERMKVCQGCDRFNAEALRCMECGCSMELKTHLAVSDCPLGKWAKA